MSTGKRTFRARTFQSRTFTATTWNGVSVAELDYAVDECTVFSADRGDRFTTFDRGSLLSSQNRGDLFSRECE